MRLADFFLSTCQPPAGMVRVGKMLRIIPFILVLFLWPVAQTSMHSSIDRSRDVATKLSRPRSLFLVQVSNEAMSKRSDMRT